MADDDTRENFEHRLTAALDTWRRRSMRARFWWRDDDAVRDGPLLQRLFHTVGDSPLALAVIPQLAMPDLVAAVAREPNVTVFQHGWAHINHAPRGRKLGAWELDGFRPPAQVLEEMQQGKARLAQLFGDRFAAVMVPPWNRVHESLMPGLAAQGFVGVTTMSERAADEPVAGLRRIDCRFDVLRWKTGATFAGWKKAADALEAVLQKTTADCTIGINTHHKDNDQDAWLFIECLQQLVDRHPAAEWARPEQLFTQP